MTMRIYAISRIYVRNRPTVHVTFFVVWQHLVSQLLQPYFVLIHERDTKWFNSNNRSTYVKIHIQQANTEYIKTNERWKKTCGKQRTHQYIEISISHTHTIRIYCGGAPCDVLPILYSKHTSTDCFQFLSIQYIKQSSSKKVIFFSFTYVSTCCFKYIILCSYNFGILLFFGLFFLYFFGIGFVVLVFFFWRKIKSV